MKKYKTIDEFLNDLDEPRRNIVNLLREIIVEINPKLSEHIKWNSPSFYLTKDDRITFNLHYPEAVKIVIHAGTSQKEDKKAKPVLEDNSGLLSWNSNIRATLTFTSLEDVEDKKKDFVEIIEKWLEIFK